MRVHLAYGERGLDIDVPATATVIEPVHHEAAPGIAARLARRVLREQATHE
jgi:lactate racemase